MDLHPRQEAAGGAIQVCSHTVTTPWNIGSEQIHEDFEVMPVAEILSITMLRLSNNTDEL